MNGSVGILHEASSARGVQVETSNGIRTYRENIIKHFRTSIANAQGAATNKIELLNYQKDFYRDASKRAANHPIKAYILTAGKDKARLYHFLEILKFQQIDVYQLKNDVVQDTKNYKVTKEGVFSKIEKENLSHRTKQENHQNRTQS